MKTDMTQEQWEHACDRIRAVLIECAVPPQASGPLLLTTAISAALSFGGMSADDVLAMLKFYGAQVPMMERMMSPLTGRR